MAYYSVRLSNDSALAHHGINGMHWGKRNGPPYPLSYSAHSSAEKSSNAKSTIDGKSESSSESSGLHLTDKQKKAIKIGAAVVGVAAATTLGVYLVKSGKVKSLSNIGKHSLPGDVGGLSNPLNKQNNCKDVAEATIKRWLGIDPGAVAGENTVKGNLHDFVESRKFNKSGIKWIGGDLGIQGTNDYQKVEKAILRSGKDGDCGIIAIQWDIDKRLSSYPEETKNIIREKIESGEIPTGHAFNFYISNNKVTFFDDQPDIPVTDASGYFKDIDVSKEIEALIISKQAFAK